MDIIHYRWVHHRINRRVRFRPDHSFFHVAAVLSRGVIGWNQGRVKSNLEKGCKDEQDSLERNNWWIHGAHILFYRVIPRIQSRSARTSFDGNRLWRLEILREKEAVLSKIDEIST